MTDAPLTKDTEYVWATERDIRTARGWAILICVFLSAFCAVIAIIDTKAFLRAYLLAFVYWAWVALGCLSLLMLGHVAPGSWTIVLRRPLEAASRTILPLFVLFIPILLGITRIYPWASGRGAEELGEKARYLNVPFFIGRAVIYFALWSLGAAWLSRLTKIQDETKRADLPRRLRMLSALGLVIYMLTATMASIDWMMSLEPRWWSTIYGVYNIGGQALAGLSFTIVVVSLLARRADRRLYRASHFHAFGKLLLAFVMLWGYFAVSQFIIIWAGNLPEEIPYYVDRSEGSFKAISVALVLLQLFVPFFLLLSRGLKQDARTLAAVAGFLLLVRFLDCYWLIVPAFHEGARLTWADLPAFGAVGGAWIFLFTRELKRRPLVPLGEPRLAEATRNEH